MAQRHALSLPPRAGRVCGREAPDVKGSPRPRALWRRFPPWGDAPAATRRTGCSGSSCAGRVRRTGTPSPPRDPFGRTSVRPAITMRSSLGPDQWDRSPGPHDGRHVTFFAETASNLVHATTHLMYKRCCLLGPGDRTSGIKWKAVDERSRSATELPLKSSM